MFAALASALLICAAAVAAGQAVLSLCGRREFTWLSGPVGLALLVVVAGIAVRLPEHGTAVWIAVGAVTAASGIVLWRRPPQRFAAALPTGLAAGGLAALFAALPFIAAGKVGILGVGLVNDDMASHLLLADWLDTRFDPEPVLIGQGYPWGPHALMAGLSPLFGTSLINVFAGLTLAIPALTAMVAVEALPPIRPAARVAAAALVALPYMAAAYLAQEAFKEPIEALLLVGFALLLPAARDWRSAIPLGVIAAGSVYAYSFPGLFWLAGTAVMWGVVNLARARRRPPVLAAVVAAVAVLLILTIPEWGRIADFTHFRAFDPGRANEGGLGNLHGYLSPLEALGVWPTSEFRLSAGEGSLPTAAFYLGALLALVAFALGLPRWIRRSGWAVPSALITALVIYAGARAFGTVYTSAKALAVAAPLVMLIALGGLLDAERRRLGLAALAAVLAAGAALSSFLVLRQAPVAPDDHMSELAAIRPLVEGEKVLFLGRDNFVLYELRGSKPFTHVRNFYDPYFVKPNFDLKDVGSKFDFDVVEADKLARYPYVLTTRAAYASGPPPQYSPVLQTDSYVLWERGGDPSGRRPVEPGSEPGAIASCHVGPDRQTASFADDPRHASRWRPSSTLESGSVARTALRLARGSWDLSLRYDSSRSVTLSAPGFHEELPGNLDYVGTVPYWPAGRIDLERPATVTIEATVESPPLAGRVLGADSFAHLGPLVATLAGPGYVDGADPPYPGSGERLTPAVPCGRYVDWVVGPTRDIRR